MLQPCKPVTKNCHRNQPAPTVEQVPHAKQARPLLCPPQSLSQCVCFVALTLAFVTSLYNAASWVRAAAEAACMTPACCCTTCAHQHRNPHECQHMPLAPQTQTACAAVLRGSKHLCWTSSLPPPSPSCAQDHTHGGAAPCCTCKPLCQHATCRFLVPVTRPPTPSRIHPATDSSTHPPTCPLSTHLCLLGRRHLQLLQQCSQVQSQQLVGHLLPLRLGAEGARLEGHEWPAGSRHQRQGLGSCGRAVADVCVAWGAAGMLTEEAPLKSKAAAMPPSYL